ncbi:MAG: 4-hydroxy-3-methylbut-2-enyl diphosphate reductase [Acidobacteria bacterium]|nr:4-hydroxy-3-methylbut-2-enyl diphosphate reductase [Acidobacteriota bacterium]
MEINLARTAGFCFGVRRAIKIALKEATKSSSVYMLGDIVHNEHVVRDINQSGIKVVSEMEHIPEGGTILLRAHGSRPDVYSDAGSHGLTIVDATCPMVVEIHDEAKILESQGYKIAIIGDHNHDEVLGIAGQIKSSIVFATPREAREHKGYYKKLGVVVQSTQDIENVRTIVSELITKASELRFINTICKPTKDHQEEIRTMPTENDLMIIVGSFTSANTIRLTEIARGINPRTHQVQSASDIDPAWFEGVERVGVSAGASTPDYIIKEVVERIAEIGERLAVGTSRTVTAT